MSNQKTCSKCGKERTLSEFYKRKRAKNLMYQAWCKECKNEYEREHPRPTKRLNELMSYESIYGKDIDKYFENINGKKKMRNCIYVIGNEPCGKQFESSGNGYRYCPRCNEIIRKRAEHYSNRPYKESIPKFDYKSEEMRYAIRHL